MENGGIDFSLNDGSKYAPQINPDDFTTNVTNQHFTLVPGKKTVYESQTEDGLERIETYVTSETKVVAGVDTVVVWDRVWLEGDLIEDTKDWYAQDKDGNVWYFGEESYELIDGKIISNHGSWESGNDGAQPGIIMFADPRVGVTYREEYYAGEAEDMAEVLSLNEKVDVPYGSFENCLQTKNFSPLEPDVMEYKYYCIGPNSVVLEIDGEDQERVELISVEFNSTPSPNDLSENGSDSNTADEPTGTPLSGGEDAMSDGNQTDSSSGSPAEDREMLQTQITEDQAKTIALNSVSGTVTDVAIEKKFGKPTYVVEIRTADGEEIDVIIDIDTGEVLAVED